MKISQKKNRMKKEKQSRIMKTVITVTLAVLMIVSIIPAGGIRVLAAEEKTGEDLFNETMTFNTPLTFNDASHEPYGYGKGVPFMMNQQSELLFYMTNSSSSGKITTVYDKLKAENTEDIFKGATTTTAIETPPVDLKKAAFVQAVSFDPRGCGRKDHIAFIGVNSTKYAYVWVYDTRNKKWYKTSGDNGGFQLVRCNWMKNDDITDYEAANFLSITAGDYDGDGKDTIVCYAAGDYISSSNKGDKVIEIKVESPDIGSSGSISLTQISSSNKFVYSEKFVSGDYDEDKIHKLGCDLDTGDINGDGIDDLVTVSYYENTNNSNQKVWIYRPYLCVMYGGQSNFLNTVSKKWGLWDAYRIDENEDSLKNKNWKSIVSPGIACGDIDNDGKDEIIAAGIKNTLHANGAANAGQSADVDKYTIGVFIIDDGQLIQKEVSANAWTTNGFYVDDAVWNHTEVESVAVNGPGNPELVFISGTLYDITDGNVTAVCTPDYFTNAGDNLDFKASTNMYIQSTAAGNFDGNDKGYEQVAFSVSCKTQSKQNYDYVMGVIGGKSRESITGVAKQYYYTSKGSMNDDNSYPQRVGGDNRAGNISEDKGLNCIVVGVDNDNDGILARYKGKSFTYSDPEVLCILQAAPYFDTVKDYFADTSNTTYKIATTYTMEETTSSSVSFGVGAVCEIGTPAVNLEVSAGYALDWSEEFTNGTTISQGFNFSANDDDQVVLSRTPVISYEYQIQDPSGVWEKNGKDNVFVISVPNQPTFKQMSIDEYNRFAEYYNKMISSYGSEYHTLDLLENEYIGVEGEPEKYISASDSRFYANDNGYTLFFDSPLWLGHSSSSTGWEMTKTVYESKTENMSHGFTFDATVTFGPNIGVAEVSVGVETSLQYMSGHSTTITREQESGLSCTVFNLVKNIPSELHGNDYNFGYQMAKWPSGVRRYVEGKAQDIPVYGFALTGVTRPAEDITNTEVVLSRTEFAYNGKVQKPTISTINGKALKEGTDYTVEWSNSSSKNVGLYEVTITGKGNYKGTAKASYRICFTDVPLKHSYQKAVYWAVDKGIAAGYTGAKAGKFGVADDITRGQVVMFLWRAAGKPDPQKNTQTFKDVPVTHNFYKAIQWANEQGIAGGYSGSRKGYFGPNDNCTRGQIAMFLWRYAGKPQAQSSKQRFSDVPASNNFFTAVQWAAEQKITAGYSDGTFGVNKTCTRGQCVTFLYRMQGE